MTTDTAVEYVVGPVLEALRYTTAPVILDRIVYQWPPEWIPTGPQPKGWLCPACGRGCSPDLATCPCRPLVVVTTTGTQAAPEPKGGEG